GIPCESSGSADERPRPGPLRSRRLRRAGPARGGSDDHRWLAPADPSTFERPERDSGVVGPRALVEADVFREYVQGGDGYRREIGETAADREADVGMTRFALAVVLAERVHALAATIARAAAHVHLDDDTRADGEAPVARHGDLAAEFMAGHVWELRRRKLAREYFRVGRADHRRPHAYPDLARSGTG